MNVGRGTIESIAVNKNMPHFSDDGGDGKSRFEAPVPQLLSFMSS